jgi:hypothetical protein
MQNEDPSAHVPFLQRPEQQPPAPPSAAEVQGLPEVRQVVLRGWHLPPVQVPLQQADELVQVALSAVQLVALAQTPRVVSHCRLQQSVFTAQELPAAPQVVSRDAQVREVESHTCVQQSAFDVQVAPTTVHLTAAPPAPAWPPPAAPACPPPAAPACPLAPPPPAVPCAPADPLAPAAPPAPR